jgi:hypothetical protein
MTLILLICLVYFDTVLDGIWRRGLTSPVDFRRDSIKVKNYKDLQILL